MLLLGWISALIFLANALLIGIPIPDPLRFLWRLSEPFSILGGIFAGFAITLLTREMPLAHPLVRLPRRWIAAIPSIVPEGQSRRTAVSLSPDESAQFFSAAAP